MKFFDYIESIEEYARGNGIEIDPLPKVKLDKSERGEFDPLAPTGNYSHSTGTITLFIDKRHVKDILRSFCHELIHHSQFLEDPDFYLKAAKNAADKVEDGSDIEKLEADAYKRGNLLIRKWTENYNENKQ